MFLDYKQRKKVNILRKDFRYNYYIIKGLYVVMNRKMRRELRKDKDLIKVLYSIIVKYLPGLLNMFDNLTDNRNQSNITYKIKNICTTRLFGLLCGLTTMTNISSDKFNSDSCIKNLSKICNQNLEELP